MRWALCATHICVFVCEQEGDKQVAKEDFMDTDDGKIKDGQPIDFAQYRKFWSLQV